LNDGFAEASEACQAVLVSRVKPAPSILNNGQRPKPIMFDLINPVHVIDLSLPLMAVFGLGPPEE
jgi:hypothetical protein